MEEKYIFPLFKFFKKKYEKAFFETGEVQIGIRGGSNSKTVCKKRIREV
jgi:hypothetical protein